MQNTAAKHSLVAFFSVMRRGWFCIRMNFVFSPVFMTWELVGKKVCVSFVKLRKTKISAETNFSEKKFYLWKKILLLKNDLLALRRSALQKKIPLINAFLLLFIISPEFFFQMFLQIKKQNNYNVRLWCTPAPCCQCEKRHTLQKTSKKGGWGGDSCDRMFFSWKIFFLWKFLLLVKDVLFVKKFCSWKIIYLH